MLGTWTARCETFGFLGFPSSRSSYVFRADGDFERVTRAFSDESCAAPAFTFQLEGLYDILERAELEEAPDALHVNYTLASATIVPDTAEAASTLARARYCGVAVYAAGVSKDVSERDCQGSFVERGGAVYDVVEPIGRTLHFGQTIDWLQNDTAEERSTRIDRAAAYVLAQ